MRVAGQWNATLLPCSETPASTSSAHCLFVNQTDPKLLATPHQSSTPPLYPSAHQFCPIFHGLNFGSHQHCSGELLASFSSSVTSNFFPRSNVHYPALLPLHTTSLGAIHALATPRHQQSMSSRQFHVNFKPSISPHCTQLQYLNKSRAFKLQDPLDNQSTHAS